MESDAWTTANKWESEWWGDCLNTLNEETKQIVYAKKMGLKVYTNHKSQTVIDKEEKNVLDIGGGPCSMLLKCTHTNGAVIDPCKFPYWIHHRYEIAGIEVYIEKAEDDSLCYRHIYDECWIYNVLQHVDSVEKIIINALNCSKIIRIFEWICTEKDIGHPNILTKQLLDSLLNGHGKTEFINQGGCNGMCYYGIFKGKHYRE
jgi:hypothetical protein